MGRSHIAPLAAFTATLAILTAGCRAHTAAPTTATTTVPAPVPAATTPAPPPPAPEIPAGPLILEMAWSHESNCSQSFAFIQLSHRFQLDVDGAGRATLVLDQRHQDSGGPAAGAADFRTAQRTYYDTTKRYTWTGSAIPDGERLQVRLEAAHCEVVAPEEYWIVMGCPEVVPRLELDCRASGWSGLPAGYETGAVDQGSASLLLCTASSPDEIPFSLWGLQEPLAFTSGEGLEASFHRGDNLIEGELIRPEE